LFSKSLVRVVPSPDFSVKTISGSSPNASLILVN
jgi:hypothetical protein